MLKNKVFRFLFPLCTGLLVFYITNKFFPEKKDFERTAGNKDFRGVDTENLIDRLFSVLDDRAIKAGIIGVFAGAGLLYWHDEIAALIKNKVFLDLCYNEKIFADDPICLLIRQHNLVCESDEMSGILINQKLSFEDKVKLVKIKLVWLIDGEYKGKRRMLILFLIGLILCVSLSTTAGLAAMLEAIYQLFKEGKISDATYYYLRKRILREAEKRAIPIL